MEELTTKQLIETLGDDVDRCHKNLLDSIDEGTVDEHGNVDADYEFHARQLLRAVFAYIEGVTFSVKITAANQCLEKNIDISPPERYIAGEVSYELNDKGEVVEHPAQIRLAANVRFAFTLLERVYGYPSQFDPSSEWWFCFKESIKVRNRLMHPRMPKDLDVSGDEIVKALKAKNGFNATLLRYTESSGE
jgi:hypothetical protein